MKHMRAMGTFQFLKEKSLEINVPVTCGQYKPRWVSLAFYHVGVDTQVAIGIL